MLLFGVHEATRDHLDHALILFTKMKRLGNYPAALRRAQLLKLINVLDFNGVMAELLEKHDDDNNNNNNNTSSRSSSNNSKTLPGSAITNTSDNNVEPFFEPTTY